MIKIVKFIALLFFLSSFCVSCTSSSPNGWSLILPFEESELKRIHNSYEVNGWPLNTREFSSIYDHSDGEQGTFERIFSSKSGVNGLSSEGYISHLHYAASRSNYDLASFLLNNGAEVDIYNNAGKTPLHRAAWFGHVDLAELLIDNGADVNVADLDGVTPLIDACWGISDASARIAMIELLVKNGAIVESYIPFDTWDESGVPRTPYNALKTSYIEGGEVDKDIETLLREWGRPPSLPNNP